MLEHWSMPRLLRKKFVCFYCGEKSVQDRVPGIRQWHCEKCEASNYLDEVFFCSGWYLLSLLTWITAEWRHYGPPSTRDIRRSSLCSSNTTIKVSCACVLRWISFLLYVPAEPEVFDRDSSFIFPAPRCFQLWGIWEELSKISQKPWRTLPTSMSSMRTSCSSQNTRHRLCCKDRPPSPNDGAI